LQICGEIVSDISFFDVTEEGGWEKYKGKNCFCKFCGLKNIRKELLPQILWIRTPNDKQNVMETFSDKMLGSIGKKLMSKVTHFLIFKV
jgi:hypothetical protein